MACLVLKTILFLACFFACIPMVYAENTIVPAESLPFVMVGQSNPPELLNTVGPQVNLGLEAENKMYLMPKYLYHNDWAGTIHGKRYIYPDREEYFKEEKRGAFYGPTDYRFKSEVEDDDKYTDDRQILREKWREFLGFDLFYLYFKAKNVENWVKEKLSVRLFNMKGRPQFKKNKIMYVFKATF